MAGFVLLGAHHTIAGGLHNSVPEALSVGSECMQIFCKSQRQWNAKPLTDEQVTLYREAYEASGLGPTMVHDSYLINMGNPDPEKAANATSAFARELERCEAIGAAFLNFHPGSHMATKKSERDDQAIRRACLERIADGMAQARDEVPGNATMLVIENAAGQGTNVGSSLDEVGFLADAFKERSDAPVGVCIDTQHAWAAGYDWCNDYDGIWDAFDDHIGLDRLVAFHLNDSKQPLGARVDRHDNIPSGHLDEAFWRHLMTDARFDGACGYLETPIDKDIGQYGRELAYLRALRGGADHHEAMAALEGFVMA